MGEKRTNHIQRNSPQERGYWKIKVHDKDPKRESQGTGKHAAGESVGKSSLILFKETSFAEYYLEKYNERLEYPDAPMLAVKGRAKQFLHYPLELVWMTDITAASRAQLPKLCAVGPVKRTSHINTLLDLLKRSPRLEQKVVFFTM